MVSAIEQRHNISITLVPNLHLETPNYEILRVREDDELAEDTSYKIELQQSIEEEANASIAQETVKAETAMVTTVAPPSPPVPTAPP